MGQGILFELARVDAGMQGLFGRVARRQAAETPGTADHMLNQRLYDGLGRMVRVTRHFLDAQAGYSTVRPYLVEKLSAALPVLTGILEEMDQSLSEPRRTSPLSPLFSRIARKEYWELANLTVSMQDVVSEEMEKLRKQEAENRTQKVMPGLYVMPFAMAAGVTVGCLALQEQFFSGWNFWLGHAVKETPPERPAPLRLVVNKP